MVFFSCYVCGDSFKKNKLDGHRKSGRCAGSTVSCIDCGVDFGGEEYAKHTSCISEADKYAAKSPKDAGDSNKNDSAKLNSSNKKKEDWTDALLAAFDGSTLGTPSIKEFFKANIRNVPLKWPKFKNFCLHTPALRNAASADELETLFNKSKSIMLEKTPAKPFNGEKSVKKDPQVVETTTTKKKNKKERKRAHSEADDKKSVDITVEGSMTTDGKKKKMKTGNDEKGNENGHAKSSEVEKAFGDSKPAEKKKSRKRKRRHSEKIDDSTKSLDIKVDVDATVSKKKMKTGNDDKENENGNAKSSEVEKAFEDSKPAEKKKSRKRKRRHSEKIDDSTKSLDIKVEVDATVSKKKKKKKGKKNEVVEQAPKLEATKGSPDKKKKKKHKKKKSKQE